MNVQKVIKQLEEKYPDKKMIKIPELNPTEILCEIEPTENHPDYSIAISVIDQTIPHYHKKLTETYEVLEGKLLVVKNGKEYLLVAGDKFVINANEIHSAKGNETWLKVESRPGWTQEDHILV